MRKSNYFSISDKYSSTTISTIPDILWKIDGRAEFIGIRCSLFKSPLLYTLVYCFENELIINIALESRILLPIKFLRVVLKNMESLS